MKNVLIKASILLVSVVIVCYGQDTTKRSVTGSNPSQFVCYKPKNNSQICFCGKDRTVLDRAKGERCIRGQVIRKNATRRLVSQYNGLRLTAKPINQSARDDKIDAHCVGLYYIPSSTTDDELFVPLQNVSVEASIDLFAADVTLTQVFVNREENPIEAIYVFPIEENAAVYSFTAQIDDRTITAQLKKKEVAEKEYELAMNKSQTAILMRQSDKTLDTFKINVGALPPGKECRITIKYVTELDFVEENSIRFVVPTTIAPRYSPSLGYSQSHDGTKAKYVQKTPYSIYFAARIHRGNEHRIMKIANRSHPVNITMLSQSINIFTEAVSLDRDIIIDIDLPDKRAATLVSVEQSSNSSKHAIQIGFTPRLSDFLKISNETDQTNSEFIFIVDCSGSMSEDDRIGLAKEAMLLFIRSLPVGINFNIIRFGSTFDILFKNEAFTVPYNETTAKSAEALTRLMNANFGGTELLQPLTYLKERPPMQGRSRQVFLLTDGEISNTDEVIRLCHSISSTTRIFTFGLGHSPSRSLVKGLARATNGYFVFIPPGSKVDTYVGSQFGRALQPSITDVHLEWHGLSSNSSQIPTAIPPLYVNDRVLLYELVENQELNNQNVTVDIVVRNTTLETIKIPSGIFTKKDTIRRLAVKASIQELQHKINHLSQLDDTYKERIMEISLDHQILSPYTAFIGIETSISSDNNNPMKVRHVPIQISKGDEKSFVPHAPMFSYSHVPRRQGPMGSRSFVYGAPQGLPGLQYYRDMQPMSHSYYLKLPQSFHRTDMSDSESDISVTTSTVRLSTDPVRWLISQQLFDGTWILKDTEIYDITNGKSLNIFQSSITHIKDALTTAIAIAVLEAKHPNQKTLWYAVTQKGLKRLDKFGLDSNQITALIDEIKIKL